MKPLRSPALAGIALAGIALGALAVHAVAQSVDDPVAPIPEDCVVSPSDEPAKSDIDSLTEALDPCDGVLKPGPVGDGEMTVLPPEGGETPVIAPDELPPQPPQGE